MMNSVEGVEMETIKEIQEEVSMEEPQYEEEEVGVSMNAMCDKQACNTIKIKGQVGRKPLTILVDSGSTHNFLDFENSH